MKTKEIKTSISTILVVDLPEGTEVVSTDSTYISYNSKSLFGQIKAPEGRWQHLRQLTDITEEQWREIVDTSGHPFYKDFTEGGFGAVCTASESGISLLKANGVILENPEGSRPECDCNYTCGDADRYNCGMDHHLWQQAQEQVWSNPHIFIKI